jgi:hypothetical protein
MIGPASELLQGRAKGRGGDEFRRPLTLVAEAARQIAAIGNLDEDFFEFFQWQGQERRGRILRRRTI